MNGRKVSQDVVLAPAPRDYFDGPSLAILRPWLRQRDAQRVARGERPAPVRYPSDEVLFGFVVAPRPQPHSFPPGYVGCALHDPCEPPS